MLDRGVDLVPWRFGEFTLVINVQEFFGLHGIQIKPITAHELKRIPLRGIVARSDCDAAGSAQPRYRRLQARRGTNAEIDYLAPGGQKSGDDCGSSHWTGQASITRYENAAAIEIGSERLCEAGGDFRCERLADDSAHSGNADFQRFQTLVYPLPMEENSAVIFVDPFLKGKQKR